MSRLTSKSSEQLFPWCTTFFTHESQLFSKTKDKKKKKGKTDEHGHNLVSATAQPDSGGQSRNAVPCPVERVKGVHPGIR